MGNKVAVFLLWLITFVLFIISASFGAIEYIGWLISAILFVIVIYPLTVIWWSRLYLSMAEFQILNIKVFNFYRTYQIP
jgi:hypothetical protein